MEKMVAELDSFRRRLGEGVDNIFRAENKRTK
jgi:hypothetical protein